MGIGQGGGSASTIQPMNPFPPPPPLPPAGPPPPVHPEMVPLAKIRLTDDEEPMPLAFHSSAVSARNVTASDDVTHDPRLGGAAGFTFAAWVRRANYGSLEDTLFELGTPSDNGGASSSINSIALTFGDGGPSVDGRRQLAAEDGEGATEASANESWVDARLRPRADVAVAPPRRALTTGPGMRYIVQNGEDASSRSVLEVSASDCCSVLLSTLGCL